MSHRITFCLVCLDTWAFRDFMSFLVVSVALLTVAVYLLYQHLQVRKQFAGIPSPRSWPVIGHALITKPDAEGFIDQVMGMGYLYPDKPRYVLLWIGPFPSVMVFSPELMEKIVTNPNHLDKGYAYDLVHPWLGLSLLTSKVERWRPKRKLLTPTFHYDILKDFVHVFNDQAKILVDQLRSSSLTVDIGQYVTLCALDIICETSMGRCVNAQRNSVSEYVRAVYRINDIIQRRQVNPLMWNNTIFHWFGDGKEHDWALGLLKSFTKQVIQERQAELEACDYNIEGRPAFLDLLLKMVKRGEMPIEDVQSEVDTFMFEGHDTTATGLTWALHLVGSYPEVQQKIYEELQDVIGDSDMVTIEHLGKLQYLECCLKESLRLYPSVPIYVRKLGCDQELGDAMLPSGTQILINAFLIHRDPNHWPDPENFIPERFLTTARRHPYSFVPFSAGSRNCIGQRFALLEEKTVMAWILRNFKVVSLKRRDEVRPKAELILRPIGGIPLKLIPREVDASSM
ncbi:hypothetical protein QR680_012482 [Steinernema hermaphroditum]|uniref:Cytochrome P450 n=1 Tax=Steinernema hermaphroditum TaxID=289476 RepID=A0AA39I263_9BILA|nr:hypothetical protein QR680_012482 [Steinernema hermaphroditum]